MNENLANYNLLDKSTNNNLNYNYKNYDNYQSWSNIRYSNIVISSIDVSGNALTTNQKTSRLQRLNDPYDTPTDEKLSWIQK
tara:strand:+ start:527 stop:772 length:246 start_codon:yes stop_codon:yes gene_type:complete